MSDLFGNHIVGFPTRRLICFYKITCSIKLELQFNRQSDNQNEQMPGHGNVTTFIGTDLSHSMSLFNDDIDYECWRQNTFWHKSKTTRPELYLDRRFKKLVYARLEFQDPKWSLKTKWAMHIFILVSLNTRMGRLTSIHLDPNSSVMKRLYFAANENVFKLFF